MTNHTPTEGQMLTAWLISSGADRMRGDRQERFQAEFDRFIAKIKADALRTEADRIERAATNITHVAVTEHVMVSNGAPGLLRESADRIERGEQ